MAEHHPQNRRILGQSPQSLPSKRRIPLILLSTLNILGSCETVFSPKTLATLEAISKHYF